MAAPAVAASIPSTKVGLSLDQHENHGNFAVALRAGPWLAAGVGLGRSTSVGARVFKGWARSTASLDTGCHRS